MKNRILTSVLYLLLTVPATYAADFRLEQFIEPATCGDCHSEIYEQWENSVHNLAHHDPVYVGVSKYFLKGLKDKGEIAEAESCVKCHTPIGNVSGYPEKTSDPRKKIAPIAKQGIQCDYCHSAVGARKMYNNGTILEPGDGEDEPGIKRGPFKDSESDFHASEYSEYHRSSEVCGTCHDVKHVAFNTDLETTYTEWKNSIYNSKNESERVTCQGCHMYQRPGAPATGSTERLENKGFAADDGPERPHISTHYFVGANSYLPSEFNDPEKSIMAIERLQHSAELSIDTTRFKKGILGINVKNTGAGHKLPTGLTDIRQMWLEISVKDDKEKILYSSGQLDADNHIAEGTIIYNTVFGDGKGNPVINISKAREILKDKRILPLETSRETVSFKVEKSKFYTVSVKLNYRSAPQKVLDMVLGKGKFKIPVVTMEELKQKIVL